MTSGVYEILNTVNGKRYIGSAVDFVRRKRIHWNQLRLGKHHSQILQRAWNKYGESSFKFLPILVCQKSMLLFYEQQLLDKAKPEYNVAPTAGSALGIKRSDKFRDALRRRKGEKRTPESRMKMRLAQLGKKQSLATRAKRSATQKGRKCFVSYVRRPEDDQNRRNSHRLTFRGETLCIAEWARRLGIKPRTIQMRLSNGWPTGQALGVSTLVRGSWSRKGEQ